MSLIYNDTTKALIDRTVRDLPHALLLEGAAGVGLRAIAQDIAWHNIAGIIEPTLKEGSASKNKEIRIEQIRDLVRITRGKLAKQAIYIIDDADTMGAPAQNAFLKLLEEPPAHISFILTSHTPQALLPTIRSRLQSIIIQPISHEQSQSLIAQLGVHEPCKTQQLLFLAEGRPAELKRLINDERYFNDRAQVITDAREFVQGTSYQRAVIVQYYASDRTKALELMMQSIHMLEFSLRNHPSTTLIETAHDLSLIYDRIAANGNVRLQLTRFVI